MYVNLLARFLLVLGGLNYFFMTTLNINLMSYIFFPKFVALLIGLSALYLLFNRDYYLPFLGPTVMPFIASKEPNKNTNKIKLSGLPANTTVVAWGAKSSEITFENPMIAYNEYENAVITKSDLNGEAIVELPCPGGYKVNKFGMSKTLSRHIHYRYELKNGMYSSVHTKFLDENCL